MIDKTTLMISEWMQKFQGLDIEFCLYAKAGNILAKAGERKGDKKTLHHHYNYLVSSYYDKSEVIIMVKLKKYGF